MRWLAVCLAVAVSLAVAGCSAQTRSSIDAAADSAVDVASGPCDQCRSDQICLARYNGLCAANVGCVVRTTDCPNNVCSPACEAAYCPQPYQCRDRAPCGSEPAGAFTCYGP